MVEINSKETRSRIMSSIKSRNTLPETILKGALRGSGFSYQPKMLGSPDFAHKKKKIVIFVDGDFWHGYNWKIKGIVPPKKYWQAKIKRNISRDKKYNQLLKKEGWVVFRIWEHDIDNKNVLKSKMLKIRNILKIQG